jgi:hypothetical protein
LAAMLNAEAVIARIARSSVLEKLEGPLTSQSFLILRTINDTEVAKLERIRKHGTMLM